MEKKVRPKITVGYRMGKLAVASDTQKRKNGYTVWLCNCDCGGSIQLDTRTLQRGTVRDCGCGTTVKPGQKDISGQRFGKLVAVEATQERSATGATIWKCLCDCGQDTLTPITQLTQGYKRSCGCLSHPPLKDYVGKRFGRLIVKGYFGKVKGMHRWECLCDCGNTTVVGQTLLQSGKTKSCGCLQARIVVDNMQFIDGTSVTLLEANRNRLISSNTSGYSGVYYNRRTQKWAAQITFKKATYYLGAYSQLSEAVKVRRQAEVQVFGSFLEWYYETYPERKRNRAKA